MKKLLALVLALVMTLGLATVGSNAAEFKDADKIHEDYVEAIDVVSAIGVMLGDEQGFRPTDTLKRSEGAKIVAYLVATNKVAEGLVGNGSKFTDVPASHWACGMVEYCVTNGIIGGVGDNKFDPDGKLTVVAFAKMMLTSLGYDAQIEGYIGGDWATNVMTRAQRVGLLKGLENVKPTDEITREQTAQMVFNTLKTAIVEYDAKISVSVNGADVSVGNSNAKPVTNEERGKQTIYDTRVNARENAGGAFVVEFAEQYYPQLIRSEDFDNFGRPATIWTCARKELGKYAMKDLLVTSWTTRTKGSTIYSAMGAKAYETYDKQLWVDGVEVETYDYNGNVLVATTDLVGNNDLGKITRNGGNLASSGRGTLMELYVNDRNGEEYARLVVINTYLAEVLASYSSATESVQLGVYEDPYKAGAAIYDTQVARAAYLENVGKNIEGLKQGDLVLVQETLPGTNNCKVRALEKAPVAEGVYISAYQSTSDGIPTDHMTQITVDGKAQNIANKARWSREILCDYHLETLKGFTYNVYADQYGNAIGIEENTGDTNFVFVVGSDTKGSNIANTTFVCKLIFIDGTSSDETIKLSDKAAAATRAALVGAGNGNPQVNAWFTFSKDDNGNITLRDMVAAADTGARNMQWASVIDGTATGTDPEISSRITTLPIPFGAGTSVVYGNDETVYITTKAGSISGMGAPFGITEVIGPSKGIKNTAIDVKNTAGLNSALTNAPADTFYLFKSSGMIIAAVVVGEDAGVAKNFVYIVYGPWQREYDKRYIDHYEAIVDGKYVDDLLVDTLSTGTTELVDKLGNERLHQVTYDKNGVVIGVKNDFYNDGFNHFAGLPERFPNALQTDLNKKAGYSYTVVIADDVLQDGNTLVINKNHGYNQSYVLVNANAKFWVYDDVEDAYIEYSGSLKSALAMARATINGNTRYITEVTSVIDGTNGFAKEVIFNTGIMPSMTGSALTSTIAANGVYALNKDLIVNGDVTVPIDCTLNLAGHDLIVTNGNLYVSGKLTGTGSETVEVSGTVLVDGSNGNGDGSINSIGTLAGSVLELQNNATVNVIFVDFAKTIVGCTLTAFNLKTGNLVLEGDDATCTVTVTGYAEIDKVVFENTATLTVPEDTTLENVVAQEGATATINGDNLTIGKLDAAKANVNLPADATVEKDDTDITYTINGSDEHSIYVKKNDTVTVKFNRNVDMSGIANPDGTVISNVTKGDMQFTFTLSKDLDAVKTFNFGTITYGNKSKDVTINLQPTLLQ